MKLELQLNGETKIFTTAFVSGRHFRQLMEFDEKIDYTNIGLEEADELIGFVCDVFGNQFDVNQFYDGIPSHKVISTIDDVFAYVRTGKTPEELKKGNEAGE
ncbi:phage tail assembly chaperone G [Alkalibacillus almallahensis]|uniref:phage tail assembly chaperone G n=1 Tax=Alkalibacillus almallahensis TaxID=1379154 RepID=UPI001422F389|nr:hypothetical protein [Alkalibacillus almallahensis]NIK10926.1 hypothetical protein [Alkalibacillus almallahensis]